MTLRPALCVTLQMTEGARETPMSDHQPDQTAELTLLVRELARGNEEAGRAVLPCLLRELKAIAQGQLRGQRPSHTLQASALVNEAYLKLFGRGSLSVSDRAHFFALAAKAMRQVLVDHARRRQSKKRGGDAQAVTISLAANHEARGVDVDVIDLHAALEELSDLDARQGRVVELRYFGGLEENDIAELLGVSRATVQRDWRSARVWLGSRMRKDEEL